MRIQTVRGSLELGWIVRFNGVMHHELTSLGRLCLDQLLQGSHGCVSVIAVLAVNASDVHVVLVHSSNVRHGCGERVLDFWSLKLLLGDAGHASVGSNLGGDGASCLHLAQGEV